MRDISHIKVADQKVIEELTRDPRFMSTSDLLLVYIKAEALAAQPPEEAENDRKTQPLLNELVMAMRGDIRAEIDRRFPADFLPENGGVPILTSNHRDIRERLNAALQVEYAETEAEEARAESCDCMFCKLRRDLFPNGSPGPVDPGVTH